MAKTAKFEIIDANHHFRDIDLHLNTDVYDFVSDAYGAPDHDERDRAVRLANMDAQGVAGAVLIAGAGYVRPRGVADSRVVNDGIAGCRDAARDRFVAGIGHVDPLHGNEAVDEIGRCAHELGLRGIAFYGMGHLMRALVRKTADLGLVPFIHVGTPADTIWQVDSLARDFPDLPIVVLHLFHAVNQIGSLAEVAERRPNLLFDLSGSISFETLGLPQLRRVGADRFVFGTCTHSWPLHSRPFGELLPDILACDLPEEDKAAILGGNIRRALSV
jgi:predicted TIM-barrel fold metal-dependent hydrolase